MVNVRRKALGKKLAEYLEEEYHNGGFEDNLTDALTNLLHSGTRPEVVENCLADALAHFTTESLHQDRDDPEEGIDYCEGDDDDPTLEEDSDEDEGGPGPDDLFGDWGL